MTDTRSGEEVIARALFDQSFFATKSVADMAAKVAVAALKDEGRVVVPREPTEKMASAFYDEVAVMEESTAELIVNGAERVYHDQRSRVPTRRQAMSDLVEIDIVKWIEAITTDWDKSRMVDGEPPRVVPNCGELRRMAAAVTAAASRITELEEENKRLRDAAAKYRDVTLKYFSDTDYDRNGALVEADAELFNILFEADRRARKEIGE